MKDATIARTMLCITLGLSACGGSPPAPNPQQKAETGSSNAPNLVNYGYVRAYSYSGNYGGTPWGNSYGEAAFYQYADDGSGACATTVSGNCTLYDCTGVAAPTINYLSAGNVAVSGAYKFPFSADANNYYSAESDTQSLWQSSADTFGTSVAFSIGGAGSIPAYSSSVAVPDQIAITQPAVTAASFNADGTTNLTVDRASDLSMKWTGGDNETFTITLYNVPAQGASPTVTLSCVVPPATGAATIPASLLGKLGAGPAYFVTDVTNSQLVDDNGWLISLGASTSAYTSDGIPYSLAITLK
jgi:hypothetical protein